MEYRKRHDVILKEMVGIGRGMYRRGFVIADHGSMSVRIGENRYLITAAHVNKGEMVEGNILVIDHEGKVIEGEGYPSAHFTLHMDIYRERPDVVSIMYASPPTATAFTVAGVSMMDPVLPEVVLALGGVPTAPFGLPGSEDLVKKVRPFLQDHDAVLMESHGAVTMGKSIREAWERLELVEAAAHIRYKARRMGEERCLSREELNRILALRAEHSPEARTPSGKIIHSEQRSRQQSTESDQEGGHWTIFD